MNLALHVLLASVFVVTMSNCKEVMSTSVYERKDVLTVKKTSDFNVTGDGHAQEWHQTEWVDIPRRTSVGDGLETKAKVLYSETGMYFLFYCEDNILTSTMEADFMDLWNEDVVEVFLWTDDSKPVYFEYELSPLNYELPILIYNDNDTLLSWQPFYYEENRQTAHATSAQGGSKKSMAMVDSWIAEFYIPYKLLKPLDNVPPVSGTQWKANLYRIDYDSGQELWSWQLTSGNFHEYKKFGTLFFE